MKKNKKDAINIMEKLKNPHKTIKESKEEIITTQKIYDSNIQKIEINNNLLKNNLFTKEDVLKYNPVFCKHCMRKKIEAYPEVMQIDNLFYARCTNCNHYDKYAFLGSSVKGAIEAWNTLMSTKNGVLSE